MKKFYSKNPFLTVTLSVILSVLIVVSGVSAATTISTNISTGGDLTVTGNSTLTGTLGVTGKTTVVNASTTRLSIGSSGTTMTQIIHGTCTSFTASTNALGSVSQAASSTKAYDCAVTGVVAGDVVIAQFATSTTNSFNTLNSTIGNNGPWYIQAAQASSTSGFITLMVRNDGAAAVPSVIGVGSSTNYIIIR